MLRMGGREKMTIKGGLPRQLEEGRGGEDWV